MDADTPTPISMTRIMATNTSGVGLNRLPDHGSASRASKVRGIRRTRTRASLATSWPLEVGFGMSTP